MQKRNRVEPRENRRGRLRRHNRELESFVSAASSAVAMFDGDMVYVAASRRWISDFRLSASPVGQSHYLLFPEIPEHWKAVHRKCLAGAVEHLEAVALPRANGSLQWVRWDGRPWRDENGNIGGIVIATEDVTAGKEAEGSHCETTGIAKDGHILDAALTFSPIRNPFGKVLGLSHVLRDINGRKRAEEALRKSEEHCASGADAATWRWDVVTGDSTWSPESAELHGRDPATTTGSFTEWLESVHPDDRETAARELKHAIESQTRDYRLEYRVLLPSGETRWVRALGRVELSDDGTPLRMSCINLDVTDRKQVELALCQSEAALRQSQARLRMAADEGRLTYAEFDMETGQITSAENFEAVMGYRAASASGPADKRAMLSRLLEHVASDDRHRVREAASEFLAGRPGNRIEYRVLGDDGVERWIASIWNTFAGPGGHSSRVTVTCLDITPQIKTRMELEAAENAANEILASIADGFYALNQDWRFVYLNPKAEAMLGEAISGQKQAEIEIVTAKAEAERANRAKSKFLAAASHDLRQPVQSLVLLLAVVERQIAANPAAVETVGKMKKALGGLTRLLTSILDISTLDAGVVEAALEAIDLEALLTRLATEYAPKAASVGLSLRVVRPRLHVLADATLLERALRNLIENGLRYTPTGRILIGARRRGRRARIDVVDTGIGVPAEHRAEIFEEFHQLDNPGRDLERGLGLGLAIVARLADLMGARVDVASTVGRGSRFSLTLPLADAPAAGNVEDAQFEYPGGRVLVIEDNSILRDGLENLLRQWGYETAAASSGEKALEVAERQGWRFGGLVTDQRLGGGLTGVETARAITRKSGRSIPALILTGATAKEGIAEIAASGFAMLHKPISADILRRRLAEMMRG